MKRRFGDAPFRRVDTSDASPIAVPSESARGIWNESGSCIAVDINANGTLSTFVWSGPAAINASNTTKVVFKTRLGGNITRPAVTPEGYGLWVNGSSLYIDLPGTVDVRFAASSSGVPENATNLESNPFYMLALRESLNWSLMLNTDPDDDGLVGASDPCPYVFDCDGDGIGDGEERANKTNATNPDSDGDGLWDGPDVTVGSAFHPGEWVNGSNPLSNDTDRDGLWDGFSNATDLDPNPFYMQALRESLNWSLMLNTDPDDDGLFVP